MSTAFSQEYVQADRLIRRRYVQIPGAQKELLERPDAWSENLSSGPRGMMNVPPEVLQDIKEFHVRTHVKPRQQSHPTQQASPAGASAPPKSSRPEQPRFGSQLSQDDQASEGDSQISWSPSPSRSSPAVRPAQPSKAWGPGPSSKHQPVSRSPISQKRKTPPRPFSSGRPSSTAQSDGVPYEPLSVLGQETCPPVNRAANRVVETESTLPAATPRSAQLEVIPSTFKATGQGAGVEVSRSLKRRRVEDTKLSDKDYETITPTLPLPKASPKPRSTAPHKDQNSSASSVSTPSFPSQTAVEQPQPSNLPQTASASGSDQRSSSNYAPTYEGRPRDTPTQQKQVLRHPASGSSMAPAPGQRPADLNQLDHVGRPQGDVGNIIGQRTPYQEFKAAYPDYEESTRAFIRACLCVEKLEYERALPEFLYDDFVRVHSTVYMDYYGEAQIRKYSEVLKATQWYNENVKDVVYTKKVIRRDNLPGILRTHAPAVRQIRESIRAAIEAHPLADDVESSEESDENTTDHGEADQQEETGPQELEIEQIPGSRESPELHIDSPVLQATAIPAASGDNTEAGRPVGLVLASAQGSPYSRIAVKRVEEEHMDDSSQDDKAVPEADSQRSRASPELPLQPPETITLAEAALKGTTSIIKNTPPSSKSPTPHQNRQNTSTPTVSALNSGSRQSKPQAPLPSLTPSGVLANDKTTSPTHKRARQSSPAFRSQDASSDDESDPFEPPVERAAMPPPRSAKRDVSAFLTQAQSTYQIPGTPDRLSEEHMPPAPQTVAQTPAAPQSRTVPGQPTSTTAVTALNSVGADQRPVLERERVSSRVPMGSSKRAEKSPASSDKSRTSLPLFKKRTGQTKEERSLRLKEHIRKRLSAKTPNSTPASTK
ncbi:hypothetical protein Daus18300_000780 [Diaporthe australafricana]|uniref:Uncharacterized protein n=1 Tax=Diaporthe australafricana TaxID=127596 RepID=A0ABR3Y219_9PEZI